MQGFPFPPQLKLDEVIATVLGGGPIPAGVAAFSFTGQDGPFFSPPTPPPPASPSRPAVLPPSYFTRTCERPGCSSHVSATCSACCAAAYCSSDCSSQHWPTHRTLCDRLASDIAMHGPSPLLDALEVAFWGRTSTSVDVPPPPLALTRLAAAGIASVTQRLRRLQSWLHPAETAKPPLASLAALMRVVAMPPCIALPDGRWAALAPDLLAGIYPDKQAALRAALATGLIDAPAERIVFGPHGRKFSAGAWVSFETRAQEALAVARHHKPLAEGEAATEADYYRRLRPATLPHPMRMRRPDVLLLMARGGGDVRDPGSELTLGRHELGGALVGRLHRLEFVFLHPDQSAPTELANLLHSPGQSEEVCSTASVHHLNPPAACRQV